MSRGKEPEDRDKNVTTFSIPLSFECRRESTHNSERLLSSPTRFQLLFFFPPSLATVRRISSTPRGQSFPDRNDSLTRQPREESA